MKKECGILFVLCCTLFLFALFGCYSVDIQKGHNAESSDDISDEELLKRCCANLAAIGKACEAYAGRYDGYYPVYLDELNESSDPNINIYFDRIPVCPLSGKKYMYFSKRPPQYLNYYAVWCGGCHHLSKFSASSPQGYPQFDSVSGLMSPYGLPGAFSSPDEADLNLLRIKPPPAYQK